MMENSGIALQRVTTTGPFSSRKIAIRSQDLARHIALSGRFGATSRISYGYKARRSKKKAASMKWRPLRVLGEDA
ncbi:MAG TPA: hypothetical protein VF463_20415 [Sphingobium sp.]